MSHADTPDPTPPKAPFFDINSILGSSKPIASGDGLQQIFKSAPPPSSKWKPSPIPGTFKGAKDGGIKGVGKLAGFKPFLQRGGGNGPGVGNIGTEGGNKPMGDDAKDKSVETPVTIPSIPKASTMPTLSATDPKPASQPTPKNAFGTVPGPRRMSFTGMNFQRPVVSRQPVPLLPRDNNVRASGNAGMGSNGKEQHSAGMGIGQGTTTAPSGSIPTIPGHADAPNLSSENFMKGIPPHPSRPHGPLNPVAQQRPNAASEIPSHLSASLDVPMNQRTNPETYQPPVRSSMDAEPTVTEENQKPAPPLRKFEMMKITAPRSASFRPLRRSGSSFDLASVMKPKEPAQPVASDVNNSLPVGSVESPALSQPHAEFRAAAGTQPVTGVAQPHGEEYLPSPSLIPMTPQFPESSVSPVHYDQRPDANRFPAANTPFPAANAPKPQKLFTPRMAPRPPAIVGSSVSPTKDLRPADAVPKPHHVITPRVPPRPPAIVGSSVSPINDLRPADAAPKPHQIITPRAPEPQVGQQGERFRREVHVSKPVESVGHQQFFSIGTPDGRLNAGNIPNQPMIPVQRVPQQMQYRPPPLQLVQTHRQIAPVPAIVPKQADYALLKQEAEANIQAALAACQEIEQDEQENLKQYMELDDIDHQLQSLRSDLVDSRARIVTVMCDILLAIDPDLCNPTYKCGGTVSVSEAASDGETVKEGNDSRPQPGNDQPTETDSAMETDMQIGTPSAQVSVGQAAEQDGEMVAKEKGGRVEEEDDGVGSSMSDGDDSDSEGSQDSDLGESEDEDS